MSKLFNSYFAEGGKGGQKRLIKLPASRSKTLNSTTLILHVYSHLPNYLFQTMETKGERTKTKGSHAGNAHTIRVKHITDGLFTNSTITSYLVTQRFLPCSAMACFLPPSKTMVKPATASTPTAALSSLSFHNKLLKLF